MLAAQRRRLILDAVRMDGSVSIATLAGRFEVSQVTVRRDLARLHSEKLLVRTHGGAVERSTGRETSYAEKAVQFIAEKNAIGALAADMVSDGAVIIIGPGTTTEALARRLLDRRGLTIITNSLPVADTFAHSSENQVIMTGGVLRGGIRALVGEATQATLSQVRADISFLSGNGLTADFGLSTPNLAVAEADRALGRAGSRIVVVADHSKLGLRSAIQTIPVSDIDAIITDPQSSDDTVTALRQFGIDVRMAAPVTGLLDRI